MATLQQAHLQKIYRPVVVMFFILATLLLVGVVYAGAAGAVITVTAVPQKITTTATITVGPKKDVGPLYLTGNVTSSKLEETVTVKPTGQGTIVPAHARGTVTFHNTTPKVQPLSAGTRLRPIDGQVIIRTTTRVDIPGGGTVTAEVVADPLGPDGNLAAGKFIIVALWPGLQDKIYATSDTAFTGGMASQSGGLSLDELTAASNQAAEALKKKFGTSQSGVLKQLLPLEIKTVPPASEPSVSYNVTVSMTGLTVSYTDHDLTTLIHDRLLPLVAADQRLISIDQPHITLENQPTTAEVVLTVTAEGRSEITATSSVLQAQTFIGLKKQEIVSKLSGTNLVKNIQVTLSPPWRNTAPSAASRIRVVLSQ